MPGLVPPVADEREGLLAFLDQQREVVRIAAHGLTDEQATATPTVSALSVAGLIKHLVLTEQGWMDLVRYGEYRAGSGAEVQSETGSQAKADEYQGGFALAPGETLGGVLDRYAAVAARTRRIVAEVDDLGRAVPVPPGVPWFPSDGTTWSVRWVLLHLIEETARHAGHADIIREAVDGATAFELMAAAENWPATPWVRPWTPPEQGTA